MADFTGREVDRVSVRVLPNLRRFLPDLQKYLKRIENQVRVDLPTSLDTTGLEAEAKRAARAIEQSTQVEIPVDADTTAAQAQIARATRPRTVAVDVDVDRSALRALTTGLDSAVSAVGSIGKVGGIGLLAGGGVTAVAGLTIAATQAAGAVGVLGAALIAAGGATGILGLAVGGQIAAMVEQQKDIKTTTDALAKLEPGTKEYAEKLAELTQLQRTFNQQFGPAATALDGLKDAWGRFLQATRTNTLNLMAGSLDAITGILPQLAPAANRGARAVGRLVDEFARWTRGSGFAAFLEWIETTGVKTMVRFARVFGNIALAFGPILAAFTPFANNMMKGMLGLSRQFRAFINEAAKTGALDDFAATSVKAFKSLAGLVGDVAGSLFSIGKAATKAAGGGLLGGLGSVFERLHNFLASPAAQKAMTAFFTGVNKGFGALGQAMGPVGEALKVLLPALGSVLGSVGKGAGAALEAIAGVVANLAGPLAKVAGVISGAIVAGLDAVGPALGKLSTGLGKALVKLVQGLAPMLPKIATSLGRLAIALANTLVPVLPGLVRAIVRMAPVVPQLLRALANLLPVIAPLLKAVADRLPAIANGAMSLMRSMKPAVGEVKNLVGPIRDVIRAAQPLIDKFVSLNLKAAHFGQKVLGGILVGALKTARHWLRFLAELLSGDFRGAMDTAWNSAKTLWGWLDDVNGKLHDWLVTLDKLPGIEIPGLDTTDPLPDRKQRPGAGQWGADATGGGRTTINVQAQDYGDFVRQLKHHNRRRNIGGIPVVAP